MASPGSTTNTGSTFPVDALEALDAATRAIAGVLDSTPCSSSSSTRARARRRPLRRPRDRRRDRRDRAVHHGRHHARAARAVGPPPAGHGLLGLIIREGRSFRIPDIAAHPDSYGFPPNHPPMRSLLGVPGHGQGPGIGNLYLTDKRGAASSGGGPAAGRVVCPPRGHRDRERATARAGPAAGGRRRARADRPGPPRRDHPGLYAVTLSLEDVRD